MATAAAAAVAVALSELTAAERAMVAAALLEGARAGAVLARLGEPARTRVMREVAAQAARGRDERVRVIVAEAQRALPVGGDPGLHPSWVEQALAGEPAGLGAVLRGERAAPVRLRKWVVRAVAARLGLVAMPAPLPVGAEPRGWSELPRAPLAVLERVWRRLGREAADVAGAAGAARSEAGAVARWLAPALAAAGGEILRETAQRLPWALGRALLEAPRDGVVVTWDEVMRVASRPG